MINEAQIKQLALQFLDEAFATLRKQHVIPTPVFHPFAQVGRDFFGPNVSGAASTELKEALVAAYPERFADPLESDHPEFPSTYMFSLLEAAIARCGSERDFSTGSDAVARSIDELLELLRPGDDEVICARAVSHLSTMDGAPLTIGELQVVPERGQRPNELERIITESIPATPTAFNRDAPFTFNGPHSVLMAKQRSGSRSPYDVAAEVSLAIDRALLSIRLLTATTSQSLFEVRGTGRLLTRMKPTLREYPHEGWVRSIRRTACLEPKDTDGISAITELIVEADVKRKGVAAAPFDVAIGKFQDSYLEGRGFTRLVELATALEATLAGEGDNAGLALRLRSRAAALLACEADPATAIFGDVGALYEIRSSLVHGGQLTVKGLTRSAKRISTVAIDEDGLNGESFARVLDRLRDLVRRALLARLCLAAGPEPLWPLSGEQGSVDAQLADDATRSCWREQWRRYLHERGAGAAADPPSAALDSLLPPDA